MAKFEREAKEMIERLDNSQDDVGIWSFDLPDGKYSLTINNTEKIDNAY
jgi:hypothetical protein